MTMLILLFIVLPVRPLAEQFPILLIYFQITG